VKVGTVKRLEIATGGRPEAALAAAIEPLAAPPAVLNVQVAHDRGCPCAGDRRPMHACTCEIVELTLERVA
jgi:hypothetical protein